MLLPLAFAAIIICLSIVCQSVSVCVCLCTPFPPEALRQPHRLRAYSHVYICVCMYVYRTYRLLPCLFLCLWAFLFLWFLCHSFLIVAFIFMWLCWPARVLQPHMVSLPYVCVCVCVYLQSMHVYEISCAWTFCFMVCLCSLFILLNSLVFIVFPSFVAAFIFCFFFTHHLLSDVRCDNYSLIAFKLFLLIGRFHLSFEQSAVFLNELLFRNRKLITMSAVTLG